ncbi:hypothetical protein V6N11_004654 [Hibiscus sabdariffa]|uniref:Uncharacterized protein n=1 Tax=Hibiscus sabdariffa TaxID=183260 RepID=A0ABR2SGX2_9ROSI
MNNHALCGPPRLLVPPCKNNIHKNSKMMILHALRHSLEFELLLQNQHGHKSNEQQTFPSIRTYDPHDTLNTSYYSYTSTILGFMKLVNLESRFDFPHNFIVSAQQYKICGQRFQLPVNADVLKKLVALVNCSESDNAELCGGDEDERFGLDCISGEHSVKVVGSKKNEEDEGLNSQASDPPKSEPDNCKIQLVWMVLLMSKSFVACFGALVPNFIMGNSVIAGLTVSFF